MYKRQGPKRALKGFVDDVLGSQPEVWSLLTNHPKPGEIESFNQALCGLFAAGYGVEGRGARGEGRVESAPIAVAAPPSAPVQTDMKESATMPQPAADSNHALGQALIPVSYTHLDVYKRQPLRSSWKMSTSMPTG